ncbi:flagellar hook assembly protein FlgD [Aquisalibacillus elongatus]|uniref:Flagellar basal-body rod modification protein FlgD n=1 Tax=Aquisalibacillus elongatus TaxID=485577 RepID=A0A3N5CFA5_9BACI|nr:flagellar hook assembly protein FlgD [Aquisalibacillus elongatus]RPF55991.1 flagellar basal-body rod modification protein FlgD [Aquisalibacillus elongatus]
MKVDSSLYLNNQNQVREGSQDLGKDDFLKILMTQLTNQDPMDPMKDQDFVAQMATFSQLEQTTNMAQNFEKLFNEQSHSTFLQYSNLIGNQVSYSIENDGTTEEKQANVQSVKKEGQDIFVTLENGDVVSADNIFQLEVAPNEEEVTNGES